MVALVGSAEAGELLGVLGPIELARVNDTSSNSRAVSVHILSCRVGNYISAPFKRTAVYGSCEGVVYDKRNSVLVRYLSEKLDVKHGQRRICDSLAEHRLGVLSERRVKLLLGRVGGYEGEVNAHSLERNREKIVSAAVDSRGSNYVISAGCDVEYRKEVCRLSRGGQHSGASTLHIAYLSGNAVVCGVLQTGIEISRSLKVKELAHLSA